MVQKYAVTSDKLCGKRAWSIDVLDSISFLLEYPISSVLSWVEAVRKDKQCIAVIHLLYS